MFSDISNPTTRSASATLTKRSEHLIPAFGRKSSNRERRFRLSSQLEVKWGLGDHLPAAGILTERRGGAVEGESQQDVWGLPAPSGVEGVDSNRHSDFRSRHHTLPDLST